MHSKEIKKNVRTPQRELVGTWCTPELVEAENVGYKIKKIHEIYHWDKTTQ